MDTVSIVETEVLVVDSTDVESIDVVVTEVISTDAVLVEVITDTGVGPQGPEGPAGAAVSSYEHSQPSASDTWIINHNLGFKPSTLAYSVGGMMMWANVQHIDDNQAQIHFDGPVSGYAVCS